MKQSRTRVKVCGITRLEDAREAIAAGVDALGFIFVENSPRYISPKEAREIITQLPPFVDIVGVFVDQDDVEVEEIIEYCRLSYVQLHGKEDPEYCQKLGQSAVPCKIIKAFRIGAKVTAADLQPYESCVTGYLFDTYVKDQEGGTGKTFDWHLIESLQPALPVILAGGLTAENCFDAIRAARPFAIDVNSGIEIRPGVKDSAQIKALIAQVRAADNGAETTSS